MHDPAEPAFWAARWRQGETRWDLGGAYPGIGELLDAARAAGLLAAGATLLEPGAGRAHTGAALARLGFRVTAFDVVEEAIQAARALYGDVPGLTLEVGDALVPRAAWRGRFDGAFDRAMLCALPPSRREAYAQALFAHLKPGAALLSAVVAERRDDPLAGPPFAVPEPAVRAMLEPGFTCVYARTIELSADGDRKVAKEFLSVWRRRAGGPGMAADPSAESETR